MENFERLGRDLAAALTELTTRIRNGQRVDADFIEQIITLRVSTLLRNCKGHCWAALPTTRRHNLLLFAPTRNVKPPV